MALPNQAIQRGVARTQRKNRAGMVIMALSCLIGLVVAVLPRFLISSWIYGVFGAYFFAIILLAFFMGLALHNRKKYKISRRYAVVSGVMLFAAFTAIHIGVTHSALGSLSFGSYLTSGFSEITPGGILFSVPAFLLYSVFFLEGAIVVLGIIFIVASAFMANFIVTKVGENKVITKMASLPREAIIDYAQPVDLNKKLEEEYQKMLMSQSKKRHNKAKSELGLTDSPPPSIKPEASYDEPIQHTKLHVSEEINAMSTEAAKRLEAGIFEVETRLQPPLYTSLGKNYVNKVQIHSMPVQPQVQLQQQFQQQLQQPYQQPIYQPPPTVMPSYEHISKPGSIFTRESSLLGARQTEFDTTSVTKPKPFKRTRYVAPQPDLIRSESTSLLEFKQEAITKQELLDNKLREFGVNAKVTNLTVAPAVTRFEIQVDAGTRVSRVTQLEEDIAYVLGTPNVRIEPTIAGKNAIGVEVPNKTIGMVSIKDFLGTKEFMQHKSPLAVVIGKNLNNELVIEDIATMPHLLIAGSTGSGKSVMLNTILTSLLFRANPDNVKLLLVDMKRVELNMYNNIPHMLIPEAIREVTHTINALKWMQKEMTRRYDLLAASGVNNIGLYQALPEYQSGVLDRMPYIVMVIDEAADLMARGKKEVEEIIQSLSALARACGIHIILATQRPSVDVITAVIKTNLPVRIAFKVTSRGDSVTILGDSGAEKLVGRGDMLFSKEGASQRVQGAYIDLEETRRVMNFIRENNHAEWDAELETIVLNGPPNPVGGAGGALDKGGRSGQDVMFNQILKWIVRDDNVSKTVSISQLQRLFSLGFARAGKIIDQLAAAGYVSENNGSKAREVLVTRSEVEDLLDE